MGAVSADSDMLLAVDRMNVHHKLNKLRGNVQTHDGRGERVEVRLAVQSTMYFCLKLRGA